MASKLQKKLVDLIKQFPILARKVEGNASTALGYPDIEILLKGGMVIFAEVKEPGDTIKSNQRIRIAQIKELGFPVYIVDSEEVIEEIVEFIRTWCAS